MDTLKGMCWLTVSQLGVLLGALINGHLDCGFLGLGNGSSELVPRACGTGHGFRWTWCFEYCKMDANCIS